MTAATLAVRLDAIPVDRRSSNHLKKLLTIARRIGADAVEIDARNEIRPADLSDTGLRQLRKMLDDLNLRVAAVRFPTRRGYDQPEDLDRRVEATKEAMRMAYRLGTPVVINQIGRVEPVNEDGHFPASTEALRTVLEDLGRYGTKVGAFLAAETGTESGSDLAAVLELGDQGYIAVALNPGQLIINRFDVREATNALADRIQAVCAVDGVLDLAAGRGLTVPLGRGTADFPELLGQLEEVPFRGPIIVGRPAMTADVAEEELRDGIEFLRTIGA